MTGSENNKIRLGNLLIPDAYSEVHGYDLAGNITSIQRNAITNFSNHTVSQIDNLAYIYQGGSSRLQSVSDAAPGGSQQMGYKPGSSTFSYDNAGNIITESGKQLGIQYNPIDLPQQITTPDGNIYIDYTFAGEKLQTYDARALPIPLDGARRWYMGAIEFKSLGRLVHHYPEGRIVEDPSKGSHWREYTLQDHLGNTVVTYADLNANGKVDANEALQHNYYYAFGMQINGNWQSVTPGSPNKYLYNGKELHDWAGLNWQDYGARWYMLELGRFTVVDPIAAQYAHVSTYNYAENEPVGHIDLWGLQKAISVIQMGKNSEGKWYTNSAFTMERGDMRWNTYASRMDLGSRGHLMVIDNLVSGDRISAFKQSFIDRALNRFDGGGPETEAGGGIMFFKTDGMGKETRFSPNADIGENIDDMMGAFDLSKAAGTSIMGMKGSAREIVKGATEIMDFSNNAFQGEDAVKDKFSRTKSQASDSSCASCGGDVHGLPYNTFDFKGDSLEKNKNPNK